MDIFDYVRGSLYTEYLSLALKLRLFDALGSSGSGIKCEELAGQLKRPTDIIRTLLETLCAMGLLQKNESDHFSLAPYFGQFLRTDSPDFIGPILDLQQSSDLPQFQEAVSNFLKDGVWNTEDELESPLSDAEIKRLANVKVNDGVFLSPAAHHSGLELANLRSFSSYKTAVDLGGNDGSFLCPIVKANPGLHGVVADLPGLEERATAKIREWELGQRLEFQNINFFTDTLPSADLYFCGFVLHDWSKQVGYFLLKKIFNSLKPGGMLVLHENLLDDPGKALCLWGTHLQFCLRGGTGGILRTSTEYCQWLKDAGFVRQDVIFGSRKSFIFATRPEN